MSVQETFDVAAYRPRPTTKSIAPKAKKAVMPVIQFEPAPRLPTTGTNAELDAVIAAAQKVFDASRAASHKHNLAEIAEMAGGNSTVFERADKAWIAHLDRRDAATLAILSVEPRSMVEANVKLHAYALASALQVTPEKKWAPFSLDAALEAIETSRTEGAIFTGPGLRAFAADTVRLTTSPLPTDAERAWSAALTTFETADAACEANQAQSRAINTAIAAEIPDELGEEGRFSRRLCWSSLCCFDNDPQVSAQLDLRARLEAFLLLHRAREDEVGLSAIDDALDGLANAVHTTWLELMRTPAPNIAALAKKIELWSIHDDDEKRGYLDRGYLTQQRHSYISDLGPAEFYADALRLAGREDPLSGLDFNPRLWIGAYEATGGGVMERADHLGLMLGRRNDCDCEDARHLEDELHADPLKLAAVWREVTEEGRRTYPGDGDVFWGWLQASDADGNPGPQRLHFAGES